MTVDERWQSRVRRMARNEPPPRRWPLEYHDWYIQPTGFHGHPLWRDVRYSYQHKDYDGPEDDRCGNAPTVEDCIEEIDEYEAEKDSSS